MTWPSPGKTAPWLLRDPATRPEPRGGSGLQYVRACRVRGLAQRRRDLSFQQPYGTRVGASHLTRESGRAAAWQTPIDADVVPSRDIRDPRFETLAGRLEEGRFRKQYAFLYEEALPQERSGMKAALKVLHALSHPCLDLLQGLNAPPHRSCASDGSNFPVYMPSWRHGTVIPTSADVLTRQSARVAPIAEEQRVWSGAKGRQNHPWALWSVFCYIHRVHVAGLLQQPCSGC